MRPVRATALYIAWSFKAFALTGRQVTAPNNPGRCPGLRASALSGRVGQNLRNFNYESTLKSSFWVLFPTTCHLIIRWFHMKKLSKMTFLSGLYTELSQMWKLREVDFLIIIWLFRDFVVLLLLLCKRLHVIFLI